MYGINTKSVKRIADYAGMNHVSLFFASSHTMDDLDHFGIHGENIRINFFSKRAEYLQAIQQADFLLLALNWPEESSVHEDEISTIFPTKTPEYLASGKPIIVHCPEHYFLYRFFKKHDCGILLPEKDPAKFSDLLKKQIGNPELIRKYQENALKTAGYFDQKHIAQQFSDVISSL